MMLGLQCVSDRGLMVPSSAGQSNKFNERLAALPTCCVNGSDGLCCGYGCDACSTGSKDSMHASGVYDVKNLG